MKLSTERELKTPAYLERMSVDTVKRLYQLIVNEITVKERYLDSTFTAQGLAEELGVDKRGISAVMSLRFNGTFNATINHYRIQRAVYLMKDKRYADLSCKDICTMCGFANRQTFYTAFEKEMGQTPSAFREALHKNKK